MLFGKRRRSAATRQPSQPQVSGQPELYVVAYEKMLKGNKLMRRGRPIRQAAVVVGGTAKIITSGDMVDRKTYEALLVGGVLSADGGVPAPPEVLDADGAAEEVST